MGFVKTPWILTRELTATEFTNDRRTSDEFLTDPDVYRGLVPPGPEPMEEPRIVVGIGTWDSNSIGRAEGGRISLAVSRDGIAGGYAVSMWMDTAVAFGRDVYGEPNRRTDGVEFIRKGGHVRASIERQVVRIIELDAVLRRNLGPLQDDRYAYSIRSRPGVNAFHLDGPAVITRATFATNARLRLEE